MIDTILKLANDSQGIAVWVLVLLLTVAWLKVNHSIQRIKDYIQLQFRYMDERLKNHKEDLVKLKEEMKNG